MNLNLPITSVRGVGPKTAATLNSVGIFTVRDLLYHFPRDYEDYQTLSSIVDLRPGKVIIRGKITIKKTTPSRRRHLTITEGVVSDQTGAVRVVWFNQPYRAKQFDPKQEYFFSGNYEFKYNRYQITSPSATQVANNSPTPDQIQAIYPARKTLDSKDFKRILSSLKPLLADLPNLLPPFSPPVPLQSKLSSALSPTSARPPKLTRAEALHNIHFPTTKDDYQTARDYLALEELYILLLAARLNKLNLNRLTAIKITPDIEKTKSILKNLPFTLTNSQKQAAWTIMQDLSQSRPMNRLLQGDVGSGKTIVACLSAAQAIFAGHQAALLAPTAILAAQHASDLDQILKRMGLKTALLTGSTKQKPLLKKQLQNGEIDLVIGTHALLTDDTLFKSLALVIIDEQHRLGVAQRQKLLSKSHQYSPHLLTMTATPIPRSLQLTVFGDLDISTLRELPKHRQPITTKIIKHLNLSAELYPKITEFITRGEQIYWVVRAIKDDPNTTTASVEKQLAYLKKLFPKFRLSALHGRLKPLEKEQIMQDFAQHKIDLLVATTVVEVGINVPNATMMIIDNASMYGLAQLHQLRGRVGRGKLPGFCFLIDQDEGSSSRRLRAMEASTDGFYLSEVDLKMRGPGEIYGSLQHGALDLRLATLSDPKTTRLAATFADQTLQTIKTHPDYLNQHLELKLALQKYQQLTTLN